MALHDLRIHNERKVKLFGGMPNYDRFMNSAITSGGVLKFAVERESGVGNNDVKAPPRLTVSAGIVPPDADIFFPVDPSVNNCVIDIARGWRLSTQLQTPADRWSRFLPLPVEIEDELDGLVIENPQPLDPGLHPLDPVRILLGPRDTLQKPVITITGANDTVLMLERLHTLARWPSGETCQRLAQLAYMGMTLCDNPQVVVKTEE